MSSVLKTIGLTGDWTSPIGIAVLLCVVLLLVVVFIVPLFRKKESYVGNSLASEGGTIGALSSGATQRRLGTSFSQPGQGEHTTVYIPEIDEVLGGHEGLTGYRYEPDYNAVGSLLDEYRKTTSGLSYEDAETAR